jgi:hypothetical protein
VALLQRRQASPETSAHLHACPPCRDELAQLAVLPGLLQTAHETLRRDPPARPGPQLLDRLLVEVDRRRRRRRWSVGLLAVAAAAAVVVAVVLGTRSGPLGTSPSGSGRAVVAAGSASDPATGAHAVITLRAEGTGSEVSVAVSRWPGGPLCRLVVHEKGGAAHEVGTWSAEGDGTTYVEDVDLPPATITRIELVDDRTGRAMLDVKIKRV